MGRYINTTSNGTPLPARGKVRALIADGATLYGGVLKNANLDTLVCVIDNGAFEAAAWVYDSREVADFADPNDRREKVWMVYPHAKQVAG
jgi:hypothetical protein